MKSKGKMSSICLNSVLAILLRHGWWLKGIGSNLWRKEILILSSKLNKLAKIINTTKTLLWQIKCQLNNDIYVGIDQYGSVLKNNCHQYIITTQLSLRNKSIFSSTFTDFM